MDLLPIIPILEIFSERTKYCLWSWSPQKKETRISIIFVLATDGSTIFMFVKLADVYNLNRFISDILEKVFHIIHPEHYKTVSNHQDCKFHLKT